MVGGARRLVRSDARAVLYLFLVALSLCAMACSRRAETGSGEDRGAALAGPASPKAGGALDPAMIRARVSPAFDVGDVVRQVHFAYRADGDAFLGGHDTYHVRATAERFEVTPVLPSKADARGTPQAPASIGAKATLETTSIGREGGAAPGAPQTPYVDVDGHLAVPRGDFTEHLRNSEDGVEQSFSFERAPEGTGDLVVHVRVSGEVYTGHTDKGHHFADPATGLGIRYGNATWIDASGARQSVGVRAEDQGLAIMVPSDLVERSAYPAVLDPTVSPEFGMDTPIPMPARNDQIEPAIAWSGSEYLVVWKDSRALNPAYDPAAIFGARVTPAGTVLDPGGLQIGTAPLGHPPQPPAVVFDGTEYVVFWSHSDNSNWSTYELRNARVTLQGLLLDPLAGNVIVTEATAQTMTGISAVSNGTGILVTWLSTFPYKIDAVRMADATTVLGGIFQICGSAGTCSNPAVTYGGGNYFVVWQDYRNGNADVYGARITQGGTVLDFNGFIISAAGANQQWPSVDFDGTNYFVVWQDSRWGTADIFASRVSQAGTVLDFTGIGITSQVAGEQTYPSVAFDGTNHQVVWIDGRSGAQDVYGTPVSPAGVALSPNGAQILPGTTPKQWTSIACGAGDCLAAWQEQRGLTGWDISGMVLDGNGAPVTPAGISISTAANEQSTPSAAFDGTNYLIVWSDNRSGTSRDIYGARVSTAGTVLDASGIGISTAVGEQKTPDVVWNGTSYLVVWEDKRIDASGDIYGARLSPAGALLDPNGFAISTAINEQSTPAVAWDGANHLVVWADARGVNLNPHIWGARVSGAGAVLEPTGIQISNAATSQSTPDVAFDGTRYFVAWYAYAAGDSVRGGRVSTAGALLDGSNGVFVLGSSSEPKVTFDGVSFLVVVGYNSDVRGVRVNPNTAAVLDPFGFTIANSANLESVPAVVFDGTDCLVAWRSSSPGLFGSLVGIWVDENGILLQPNAFTISSGSDHGAPALAADSTGHALIAYTRSDVAEPFGTDRVRARLIKSVGTGLSCTVPSDCATGFCVDGVCCNSACGGNSPGDCLACSVAAGASADGNCTPLTGTTCNDGNGCTQTDACQAGTCVGANPVVCADPDNCHAPGQCQAATGQCTFAQKPNGTTCDDGNPCTVPGQCSAGACTGQAPVICQSIDACHDAGVCDIQTGQCTNPAKPDGTSCTDNNGCTQTDTCQSGACVKGDPVVCPPPSACKQAGTCDPVTGTCAYSNSPDGTACDDGDACTQVDSCAAGICVGKNPVTCPSPGQCQAAGTCNPATGDCVLPDKPNGTSCTDGNACTNGDKCNSGVCKPGVELECPEPATCHKKGSCNPSTGVCSKPKLPDQTACDDKDVCTQEDHCLDGVCTAGIPVVCTGSDECHDGGTCAPMYGCEQIAKPDGTPCSAGVCEAGACVPETTGTGGSTDGGGGSAGGEGCSCRTTGESGQDNTAMLLGFGLLALTWARRRENAAQRGPLDGPPFA